jgi:hypothetical protein
MTTLYDDDVEEASDSRTPRTYGFRGLEHQRSRRPRRWVSDTRGLGGLGDESRTVGRASSMSRRPLIRPSKSLGSVCELDP